MSGAENLLDAAIVLGTIVGSLGLMILVAGDRDRTTIGFGTAFVLIAPQFALALHLAGSVGGGPEPLARVFVVLQSLVISALAFYVSGLASTSHASAGVVRKVQRTVVLIYLVAAVIVIAGLISPQALLNDFILNVFDAGASSRIGFWVFIPLYAVMTGLFMYAYFLLFRGRLDSTERARAICAFLGSPILVAALFGTPLTALVFSTGGTLTAFYGVFGNAVAQGQRGAFLSRFLSPQVAEQVRVDGLTTVMQPAELVLTVVACDLRGFTAYAEGVPSQAVIDLLGEYYEAVGMLVAEVDGTIKDYAGDGILILIGAPLPHPDHASAGLALSRRIHQVTRPVLDRWATGPHPLGIGVGIATGRVTVGAIGSDARMEYTAVGTPVNLAARLCSAAADGETLIDGGTRAATVEDVESRGDMSLKGLSHPLPVFAYTSEQPAR